MRTAPLALMLLCSCGARTGLEGPPQLDVPMDVASDVPIDVRVPADVVPCSSDTDCDDRIACTTDVCQSGRCAHAAIDSRCDDGVYCNGSEICVRGTGCIPSSRDCRDAVPCTVDRCDEARRACAHEADPSLCPISHRCDGAMGCVARAIAHDFERLFEIDLPSGRTHPLGFTGMPLTDIALHPNGTLYGALMGQLVTVDYLRATTTRVADVPGRFVGLEVSAGGTLYGSTDARVVRIDLVAGRAIDVTQFPAGFSASGDLAFVQDTLYGTAMSNMGPSDDVLVRLPLDGRPSTVIGATGVRCLWGLAPLGTTLYGMSCMGDVVLVDVTNGSTRLLARTPTMFWGAAAR